MKTHKNKHFSQKRNPNCQHKQRQIRMTKSSAMKDALFKVVFVKNRSKTEPKRVDPFSKDPLIYSQPRRSGLMNSVIKRGKAYEVG